MGRLDGRVAVVTGTSRGIGKAIAELFAAEGARVVCAARTVREGDHRLEGALHTTIEGIRAAGGEAIAVQANVALEDDCFRLIEQAEATTAPSTSSSTTRRTPPTRSSASSFRDAGSSASRSTSTRPSCSRSSSCPR